MDISHAVGTGGVDLKQIGRGVLDSALLVPRRHIGLNVGHVGLSADDLYTRARRLLIQLVDRTGRLG